MFGYKRIRVLSESILQKAEQLQVTSTYLVELITAVSSLIAKYNTPPVVEVVYADTTVKKPEYKTAGSSGMDVCAWVADPVTIQPGQRMLIPTGLRIAIPSGFEVQVRPRSGLALKNGITVLNTPGTIDADFRGSIGIILINLGEMPFVINNGDRIAQLVLTKVERAVIVDVTELSSTTRGENGYGSTGIN